MGAFLVGAASLLLFVVLVGAILQKVMPPASFDDRPWPTPPRFPPGKVGEFMAEEELRRRIADSASRDNEPGDDEIVAQPAPGWFRTSHQESETEGGGAMTVDRFEYIGGGRAFVSASFAGPCEPCAFDEHDACHWHDGGDCSCHCNRGKIRYIAAPSSGGE